MGRGVNKVILVGNLGNDPDMKHLANGTAIANISVATSESWNDKTSGEKVEKTEWHRCAAFGKLAEIIEQYVRKGSLVYIEGSIHTRKWQDDSGADRYSTEIKIRDLQMLGSKSDNSQRQESGGFRDNKPAQERQTQQNPAAPNDPSAQHQNDAFNDDDIPF